MQRTRLLCLAATVIVMTAPYAAIALPTPDPISGHYYEEFTTAITWDEARVDAPTHFQNS